MKTHINLSIEKDLVKQVKAYAEKRKTSVSDLVEEYFMHMVSPAKRSNIIEMIENLKKPVIEESLDLKKAYHEERASKNGF
jgi:hypothetical protein